MDNLVLVHFILNVCFYFTSNFCPPQVVPLPNLQVASMRRELEAEPNRSQEKAQAYPGQGRATSPSTGRVITPQVCFILKHLLLACISQMGTGSHAPLLHHGSPGPLARLHLDTLQPYESPLRSTFSQLIGVL